MDLDLLVHLESSLYDLRVERCDLAGECARSEEPLQDGAVDRLHRIVVEEGEGDDVQVSLHTWCDLGFTTAWRSHGADKHRIDKGTEGVLVVLEIIPTTLVEHLTQDLNGRLRSILLDRGHIEIIDKDDDLLAKTSAEYASTSLLELSIDNVLHLVAASLGGEADLDRLVFDCVFRVQLVHEHVLNVDRLASTSWADVESGDLV